MGPFYCPGDEKIYLDLGFFDEMARRFRAGGDFARAYVIAHEVGHHVQRLTGVTAKVEGLRSRLPRAEYNKVSVRVELQADCFAGVWAHHASRGRPFLDPGDVEEALAAANAIGDDALQRQSGNVVVPERSIVPSCPRGVSGPSRISMLPARSAAAGLAAGSAA